MKIPFRPAGLKLSGKMTLFFVVLVLAQSAVTLVTLTVIISRTNLDSLKAQMSSALLAVDGYLTETFDDLRVKGQLIAGQQKTIDYTDFGLANLLSRELVLFKESLGIDSLVVFVGPEAVFAGTHGFEEDNAVYRAELGKAFGGSVGLFVSEGRSGAHLFVLSPIKRADRILGVLSLGLTMDQALVARIERIVGSRILVSLPGRSIHDESISESRVLQIERDYARASAREGRIITSGLSIVGSVDLPGLAPSGARIYCLLDTAASVRQISRYNIISLVITCLILSLALLSGIVFYRLTIFRKFQTILSGISHIAEGDFRPPFRLPWQDEFGQLAAAFDDMCGRLLVRETELKSMEERLSRSSKLAALGEMAAGVAHQIRNPLVVMKVSAEMLRDGYTVRRGQEKYRKLTRLIVDEIDTLNVVVSTVLDFARPRRITRAPCSVRSLVDFALETLPLEQFKGIAVRTCIPDGLAEFSLDRNLLTQAVSNLVLNALQASQPGSAVEIRACQEAGRLRIDVQDWGTGIEEGTTHLIFNPFYTTRDSGTGLGLSIAHRIVEEHGGTIDVSSHPGKGSTFTIRI